MTKRGIMISMKKAKNLTLETVGLMTPRGRLLFFTVVTTIVLFTPAVWPVKVSIWQQLKIPSPSIGLTRAYRRLLHGDFLGAWDQNKLIYAVVAIGGGVLVRDAISLTSKSREFKTENPNATDPDSQSLFS